MYFNLLTLLYSALMRLPEKMPHHLKLQRVEAIIELFELSKCASTVIGFGSMAGISGGERKRASIAIELLSKPVVLLIDEPTSGLDYSVAYSVMSTLQKYTLKMNTTVITTIHQPSSKIFHMYKQLLILADGQLAYFGSTDKVISFFGEIGMVCEPNYNPADFIIEKLRESRENCAQIMEHGKKQSLSEWPKELLRASEKEYAEHENHALSIDEDINELQTTGQIPPVDKDTGINGISICVINESKESYNVVHADREIDQYVDRNLKWPTGFMTQYFILLKRTMKLAFHHHVSMPTVLDVLVLGFITCVFWFQVPSSEEYIDDFGGVTFFICVHTGFMQTYGGIHAFSSSLDVINRERASGIYRLSSYYLATLTANTLMSWLRSSFFYICIYWCVGYAQDFVVYLTAHAYLLLVGLGFQSIGCLVAILVTNPHMAFVTATTVIIGSLLLGGFLRNTIPYGLRWMPYLSYINYAYQGLMSINFIYGPQFRCAADLNETAFPECHNFKLNDTEKLISGENVLKSLNITIPLWLAAIIVAGSSLFFIILGYIMLRFVKGTPKPKY